MLEPAGVKDVAEHSSYITRNLHCYNQLFQTVSPIFSCIIKRLLNFIDENCFEEYLCSYRLGHAQVGLFLERRYIS